MEPRPAGANSPRTATHRLLPRILPASKLLSLGTVLRLFWGVRGDSEGGEGGGVVVEASEWEWREVKGVRGFPCPA